MSRSLETLQSTLSVVIDATPSRQMVAHPARDALVEELEELGRQLDGVVPQRIYGGGLALSLAGRSLVFLPQGSSDFRICYPDCGDERLVRDPTGQWMWKGPAGRAVFNEAAVEGLLRAAFELAQAEDVVLGQAVEVAKPKGPRDGQPAQMGRSGSRSLKRSSDLPPGGVVKDLKGPFG